MKYSYGITALALCSTQVVAFPSHMFNVNMDENERREISRIAAEIEAGAKSNREIVQRAPGFVAEDQLVSTSGQYAFVEPDLAGGDLRGPCPGLNAMANHGYIPHNGVATISQFITGTAQVFGMGPDLAGFLAVYGAIFNGDLSKWSIGGPPPAELLGPLGLLAQPRGLSGSHNNYESDVSPTRPDLYEYGNNYKVIMSQWEEMFATPQGPRGYDLTTMTAFRANRFQQSISNNSFFFNGPFSGVLVQPAAYTFIYRFMSNKSSEFPEGFLNEEVLKSFFSITGEPGSFEWTEGYERIPDNWYKRATGDDYTIPFFLTDAAAAAAEHPQFLNIGGNTGTPNSFAGLDLQDPAGGLFNFATLLEGNNAACFAHQSVQQLAPDTLRGLFTSISEPLAQLTTALDSVFGEMGCPELVEIDKSNLEPFPGAEGTA